MTDIARGVMLSLRDLGLDPDDRAYHAVREAIDAATAHLVLKLDDANTLAADLVLQRNARDAEIDELRSALSSAQHGEICPKIEGPGRAGVIRLLEEWADRHWAEIDRLRAETLTAADIASVCAALEDLYPDAPSVGTQLVGAIFNRSGDGRQVR